jgi:FkbM family methyltransferase
VRQVEQHQISVVLDVGANAGQFAQKLVQAGFKGRVVSFEAAKDAHEKLVKNAGKNPNWQVAPRLALGHYDGDIKLNIADNSASSSVLPMLELHVNADPTSRYIGSEDVPIRKLDSVAQSFVTARDRVFLKLDVQGFEAKVLHGAAELLKKTIGLQLELSLVPLYSGERRFLSMLGDLEEHGFELWSLSPGFVDRKSGRLLQVDAVLFRPAHAASEVKSNRLDVVTVESR